MNGTDREMDLGNSRKSNDVESSTSVRVVMLEDAATDAELIESSLREGGLTFAAKRVETREAYERSLDEFGPDVILVDFKLPSYDGLSGIRLARRLCPHVPVIVVTGALGDESAVELMKAGACDYVLKDRLARLPVAIEKALADAERTTRIRKEEATTRAAEQSLYAIAMFSQDAIMMMNERMEIIFWNKSAEACFGYSAAEVVGQDFCALVAGADDISAVRRNIDDFVHGRGTGACKLKGFRKDAGTPPVDISISVIQLEGKWNAVGVVRPQSVRF